MSWVFWETASTALKTADIGLSVDNATDIARESADMILMEQNLLVLRDGVLEGRKVYGNLIKYLRMTTSSNFGNALSMVGACFLLPFLPLKPIHILIQNLLYDFSQTAVPFDNVDEEFLQKPRRWEVADIERFMLCFGPVSSLFDYVLFAVMWFVFEADAIDKQALFQAGWFMEGLLSQTLIVHLIRTRRIPFLQSRPAPFLLSMTLLVMAIGIYIPYSPLSASLGFTPPGPSYFAWLTAILSGYCLLTQRVKRWFILKYGYD
jgi:Mg2+-importing ATPase